MHSNYIHPMEEADFFNYIQIETIMYTENYDVFSHPRWFTIPN